MLTASTRYLLSLLCNELEPKLVCCCASANFQSSKLELKLELESKSEFDVYVLLSMFPGGPKKRKLVNIIRGRLDFLVCGIVPTNKQNLSYIG